jgi:predicted ribonuclease YlaK
LPETNDTAILGCAIACDALYPDEVVFVTNDLALKSYANLYFGDEDIISISPSKLEYKGFLEIQPTEQELTALYTNMDINHFDLFRNEYLILRGTDGEVLDRLCWTGETHRSLKYSDFTSWYFGSVKPYKGDPYQAILFDSLINNDMTLVGGPAGSGKTYIALAYLFSLLDKGVLDRVVIFCNPVVAKDAAKLGFYPGELKDKLLSSQVGNVLVSKIGGIEEVERLMGQEKLILMPVGDARGYEVPPHSGVYIMEAQNLNVNLMKLILQRIGNECVTIIDGDRYAQTDIMSYELENGMKRVSEVFKGEKFFGQVDLQNIYRSRIANVAEKL